MYDKIWSNIFMLLLWLTSAGLVIVIFASVVSDKPIIRYTLMTQKDTGVPYIRKEVDWEIDEDIYLDRFITWDKAIQIVDSLNKSLKK